LFCLRPHLPQRVASDLTMAGKVVVLLFVLATTSTATKVDFYFEYGCPVCGQLLGGDGHGPSVMDQVSQMPGVIVELHPFGNSLYATAECGVTGAAPASMVEADPRYTVPARKCWDAKCGAEVAQKAADCFVGEPICQHGRASCELQTYALCGKASAGTDWQKAYAFAQCLDKNMAAGVQYGWPEGTTEAIAEECAGVANFGFGHLKACARGPMGAQSVRVEGSLTPIHSLIPYVLVDGAPADPAQLLRSLQVATAANARRLLV